MYQRKKKNKNSLTNFLLCCMLFLPAVNNFLNCIFQIGMQRSVRLLTPIAYVFLALVGGFSYLSILKKNRWRCFVLVLALMLGISYFSYPEIQKVMFTGLYDLVYNPMYKIFIFCIPAMFFASRIDNFQKLYDIMIWFSRITLAIGVFAYVFVVLYKERSMQYMVYSYFMITAVCACFENFIHKHNCFDLILALVGSVAMILCGARGAIVSLALYVFLRFFLFYPTKNKRKRLIAVLFLLLGLICIALFFEPILLFAAKVCENLGVDSRVVTTILEGKFLDGSGREKIVQIIIEALKERPFGYGLYGDRYVTGAYGWGRNTYAHNFILEIFCDFGFFGIFILLCATLFFIYIMNRSKNPVFHSIIWALIPYGLFQLFFSSSFMENILFYVILGFLINKKASRKSVQLE